MKAGIVFSVIVGFMAPPILAYDFAGGIGDPNDPYQIATSEQLISIGSDPNLLDKSFVLINDIDLDPNLPTGRVFDRAVIAPDMNEVTQDFQGTAFTGNLDGQDYSITKLVIDSDSEYTGLFGLIGGGGVIHNIHLIGGSVRGKATSRRRCGTGGLAGENRGIIQASHCHMAITGLNYVGGLVGQNCGTILRSISTGFVTGTGDYVGGLVGFNNFGTIAISYSSGSAKGEGEVGGLVGFNQLGKIISCCSIGAVSGTYSVGGLVGRNNGAVLNCYSMSTVDGTEKVGGLVGYNSDGTISICYSTGLVGDTSRSTGGLVGYNQMGTVSACFWDTETSGHTVSDGGTGLTTYQMQDIQTFLDEGWDFLGEPENGTCEFWQMPEEDGYPVLGTFNGYTPSLLQGKGTLDDPYIIDTADDLGTVWFRSTACYQLVEDIDLSGITWGMAVIPVFGGQFDGQGHRINGMTISGGGHLGLFGILTGDSMIWDLALENACVTGMGGYVGSLVGWNDYGTISVCYTTGSVSAEGRYVGGLVGWNYYGAIPACYSTSYVSGTGSGVGGLVGYNDHGTISVCYSTGSVSGKGDSVGGLVGKNRYGTISVCYSTGPVSGTGDGVGGLVGSNVRINTISACFWDTETSGQTVSEGGTGLTTYQMQDIQTFLDAGWDFLGERENGTCEFWQMPDEDRFPVLSTFSGYTPSWLQGQGTLDDPYIIKTADDLGTVWFRSTARYQLVEDIDLSGITWGVAVIPTFGGRFDGQGHRIHGMTVSGGGHLGLFGILAGDSMVWDLALEDVYVAGTGGYIGGLAGVNRGTISMSRSAGSVNGADDGVGGLVGENRGTIMKSSSTDSVSGTWNIGGLVAINHGTILMSHSSGTVNGTGYVGGLVGWNGSGKILTSYSTDSVSGTRRVGGLVGYNSNGVISSSYSTGMVSGDDDVGGLVGINRRKVTTSFWDVETTGLTESAGGIGLTTAEMQDINTYLNAGWDFDTIWSICAGLNYPRLQWENVLCE